VVEKNNFSKTQGKGTIKKSNINDIEKNKGVSS
jgi:hypothetical protein